MTCRDRGDEKRQPGRAEEGEVPLRRIRAGRAQCARRVEVIARVAEFDALESECRNGRDADGERHEDQCKRAALHHCCLRGLARSATSFLSCFAFSSISGSVIAGSAWSTIASASAYRPSFAFVTASFSAATAWSAESHS